MIIKHGKDGSTCYFFDTANQPNPGVQMGKVVLMPGKRSPQQGYARHEQDEYAYVIKGKAHTVSESGEDALNVQGDVQMIPAGEAHYNYNDSGEPAEVLWMLVKR